MININDWMMELTHKLQTCFKSRLLFVGLQGSYKRGEAHQDSDIDAVVILDTLSSDDLINYRKIILTMPESGTACGFVSDKQDLLNWPRYELFQFEQDTLSYYGKLHELLPPLERQDLADSAKISAAGLYHSCCHTIIHDPENTDILKNMYKSAFFLLQIVYYLRHGIYVSTKQELLPQLLDDERKILDISINWSAYYAAISADPDIYFDLLFRWLKTILNTAF